MKLMERKEGLKYSIIIVNWNTLPHLVKCVQSLFKHTENFELIIVDNGSTDGSRGYILELADMYPNVKYILNDENRNFGPANNQGLEVAEGQYIVCLNSDTVVTPKWAERLENCIKHRPNIAMVGPVSNMSNGRQNVKDPRINNSTARSLPLDNAAIWWANNYNHQYLESGILYGWCIMISREFLDQEPFLFDPIFTNAYEDNDLSIRAMLRGFKLFIDYGTFIAHEGQASFRANDDQKTFHKKYMRNGEINQDLFFSKYQTKNGAKKKLIAVYRIANCDQYIAQSLEQTSKFADEIICLFARSKDRTKEIALSFPKVTLHEEWNEPKHPFDEQAERDWLLQKAIERGADWIISIDGDEIYEDKFIELVPKLMNPPNPHTFGYWTNWRTIWEREGEKEYYRSDSTFGAFQNYRFFRVLPGMKIERNDNLYNHHCGSAPILPSENLVWLNVRVKHLGYDSQEQRKRKYDFYKAADPKPLAKDVGNSDYHHLIEKNVQLKLWKPTNRISVMTICKNESDMIYSMLKNVERIADEYVIVDNGSTDGTLDEIHRFAKWTTRTVRLIEHRFESVDENGMILNYSEAKNWAKSKCKFEWILQMDADEIFVPKEVGTIFGFIDEEVDGLLFNVMNYLKTPVSDKPEENEYSISEAIRLYRNIDEIFYTGLVHESLEESITNRVKNGKGRCIWSPIMIHHRGYLKDKTRVKEKVLRYHRINQMQSEISGGKDPRPFFNMGLHLLSEGNTDEAIHCFNRSIELEPSFWRAKHQLAWKSLDDAKRLLNSMAEHVPAAYKERNLKIKEIMTTLNKFDFTIRKVSE